MMKNIFFALMLMFSNAHTATASPAKCKPALSALTSLAGLLEPDESAYAKKEGLYNFLSATGVIPSKAFYASVMEVFDLTALKNLSRFADHVDPKSLEDKSAAIVKSMTARYESYYPYVTLTGGKVQARLEYVESLNAGAKWTGQDLAGFMNSVQVMKDINEHEDIRNAVTEVVSEALPYYAKSIYYKSKGTSILRDHKKEWDGLSAELSSEIDPIVALFGLSFYAPFLGIKHSGRNVVRAYSHLRSKAATPKKIPFSQAESDLTND